MNVHQAGQDLKARFTEAFGNEGQNLVTELIEAGRLNGGIDLSGAPTSPLKPTKNDDYYPGVSYAHATGYYFMRQALDDMSPDDAYDQFLLDVDAIDKTYKLKEVHDRYPDQRWMEDLCKPYFADLEEIKNPKGTLSL